MPAGMSWPKYLTFMVAAMFSMMAGSQTVHVIFEPLKDLPECVEREKARLRALQQRPPDQ